MNALPVRIGLAGLGTVGSGLVTILQQNVEWICRRLGRSIVVVKVLERDLGKPRAVELGPETVRTTDPDALVNDPDIDIVVELMAANLAMLPRKSLADFSASSKPSGSPVAETSVRNCCTFTV